VLTYTVIRDIPNRKNISEIQYGVPSLTGASTVKKADNRMPPFFALLK